MKKRVQDNPANILLESLSKVTDPTLVKEEVSDDMEHLIEDFFAEGFDDEDDEMIDEAQAHVNAAIASHLERAKFHKSTNPTKAKKHVAAAKKLMGEESVYDGTADDSVRRIERAVLKPPVTIGLDNPDAAKKVKPVEGKAETLQVKVPVIREDNETLSESIGRRIAESKSSMKLTKEDIDALYDFVIEHNKKSTKGH